MSFPPFSFFYKITSFYKKIKLIFLYSYYYKLHNILFTNLYIRIYRYKLIQLEKRKRYSNQYKLKMDSYSDRLKKKGTFKRKSSSFLYNSDQNRNFSTISLLFAGSPYKNDWSFNKVKTKKKKQYIYVNKFKDCGNQYNFDPFHLGSTYKLDTFDFNRIKKYNKKQEIVVSPSLSSFDFRLNSLNFKYFNNYTFSLILDVFKQKTMNKDAFIISLKNSILFMFNFLLFFKKRILKLRFLIAEYKRLLRIYIYKLNAVTQLLTMETNELSVLSYLKKKNKTFFIFYLKFINSFDIYNNKYIFIRSIFESYIKIYKLLFDTFKVMYQKKKIKNTDLHIQKERVSLSNSYELIHSNIHNIVAKKMRFFKFGNTNIISKWEKCNIKNSFYLSIHKYITLFRSYFKNIYLNGHISSNAIVYIKATISNVYLYFIYNNKILFKKSCGELFDVKKKERRFWRNVYPLVETLLPILVKYKALYKFPTISLYLNGSDSLCTPLLSRLRKHNKKFRRLVYFLFNELDYFIEKTLSLKEKHQQNYIFYPIYRLKFYAITDGFNRLSKLFFAINKVQDITSWPYNGCKRKKKKNVR